MNLHLAKRRPQTQQLKQNEKREKHTADEEQGKNRPDQTNEEEIGSLPEKIQSNDTEDDPKSWK